MKCGDNVYKYYFNLTFKPHKAKSLLYPNKSI